MELVGARASCVRGTPEATPPDACATPVAPLPFRQYLPRAVWAPHRVKIGFGMLAAASFVRPLLDPKDQRSRLTGLVRHRHRPTQSCHFGIFLRHPDAQLRTESCTKSNALFRPFLLVEGSRSDHGKVQCLSMPQVGSREGTPRLLKPRRRPDRSRGLGESGAAAFSDS